MSKYILFSDAQWMMFIYLLLNDSWLGDIKYLWLHVTFDFLALVSYLDNITVSLNN